MALPPTRYQSPDELVEAAPGHVMTGPQGPVAGPNVVPQNGWDLVTAAAQADPSQGGRGGSMIRSLLNAVTGAPQGGNNVPPARDIPGAGGPPPAPTGADMGFPGFHVSGTKKERQQQMGQINAMLRMADQFKPQLGLKLRMLGGNVNQVRSILASELFADPAERATSWQEIGGRRVLVDDQTGTIIRDPSGPADPNQPFTKDQSQVAGGLRDDIYRGMQTFEQVQEGWNGVMGLLTGPSSGTADFALVVALAKILDPGSVVRGEEVRSIQQNQGRLVQHFGSWINNAITGKAALDPTARRQLVDTARKLYLAQRSKAQKKYGRFKHIAKKSGFEIGDISAFDMGEEPPTAEEWDEFWKLKAKEWGAQ
jgi:hypothetical protein